MASNPPPRQFDNHRLGIDQFDQIAGGLGSPATIRALFDGERSRRLLLVRKLLRHMEDTNGFGPLPTASEVWDLLAVVQKRSPEALTATLMYPAVGTWLSRALRLIRSGRLDSTPIWAYAGQMHTVAFAAAVRAGIDCDTVLPVVDGHVMLPGLGLARFPGCPQWTVGLARHSENRTTIRRGGTTVELPAEPGADGPGWWGLREIAADGDAPLRIFLDDVDPHRNLADPVAPGRLPDAEFTLWHTSVRRAWALLGRTWPAYAASLAAGLAVVTPLPDETGTGAVRSASTGDAFGAAVFTFTNDDVLLASTLVHEFQHIKLGGLLHLVPLHDEDSNSDLYAPWRPDPRPFGGLFQGTYAFLGIADFWCHHRNSAPGDRLVQFEFAYARRQVLTALRTISGSSRLTELGQRFVDGMRARARRLRAARVSTDAARAAWAAATDHRTTWLLRNVVPDPSLVSSLLASWRHKRPPSVELAGDALATAPADTDLDWLNARHILHRMRLSASRRYLSARAGTTDVGSVVEGATEADIALLEADPATAVARYRSQIQRGPAPTRHQDDERWAGLAIAAAAARLPAWRMLCRRPYLVRAVHAALVEAGADPDPVGLADWLETAPRPTTA